jgi:hypothetical protein
MRRTDCSNRRTWQAIQFQARRLNWQGALDPDFVTIADLPVLDFVVLLARSPHLISSSYYV